MSSRHSFTRGSLLRGTHAFWRNLLSRWMMRALVAIVIFLGPATANAAPKAAAPPTADSSAPAPDFVGGIIEFGEDPPAEGQYYWPEVDGKPAAWRALPENSSKPPGEGFPQKLTLKCSVGLNGEKTIEVNCEKSQVTKTVLGRVRGVVLVKTWTVSGDDGNPETMIGVTLVLETMSVSGHVYAVTAVESAPAGHEKEAVFSASTKKAGDFVFRLVHLPIKK